VLLNALALGVQGVAAPSANLFGRVSPTTAAHVRQAFPDLPVLDGGACDVGIESTIVDASRGSPFLLRPGMLTPAQLSEVCGMPVSRDPVTASGRREAEQNAPGSHDSLASPPATPGSLASHYAPRARLRLMTVADMATALQISPTTHVALWLRSALAVPPHTKLLTMPGDAAACAHDLFARLHELDAAGVDEIWVETPPADAAWDGVRDRLQRASA
jgi:L-threonylcarbamoyladenylate synthase